MDLSLSVVLLLRPSSWQTLDLSQVLAQKIQKWKLTFLGAVWHCKPTFLGMHTTHGRRIVCWWQTVGIVAEQRF